jgi:hypothetical protein
MILKREKRNIIKKMILKSILIITMNSILKIKSSK